MGSGPRGAAQDYISGQQANLNSTRNSYQGGLDTNARNAYNTVNASATGGPSGGASIFNPSQGIYASLASGGINALDPQVQNATSTFGKFATTGGFSPEDIQNMRARAVSPIGAAAANAQQGINQTRALQGGFSPNTTAALAQTVRNLGYGAADATTNADAGIAQQVSANKLAGAQGSGQIAALDAQLRASGAAGLSAQEQAALQAQMGLTNLSGSEQMHNLDETQSGNLGWGQQYENSFNLPTGFQSVMGNINSALQPLSTVAGAFTGGFLPTSFGGSSTATGPNMGTSGSYGNIPMSQWQNFGTPNYAPPSNSGGVLENF